MSTTDSPVLPPWMDKKVLQVWLRKHYGEVAVAECEVRNATAKGDNYLSNMHRLVVKTKSGDSHRLLIKCIMEEGEAASIMRESSIFRREHEMYVNTLPRMSALLRKAMPGNFEPLSPKCIYACKTFLVLEDLSVAGFGMGERRKGLDLEYCVLLMRTVARFHAASAVLHQQDPDSMKEYDNSFLCDPSVNKTWPPLISGMSRTLAEELDTWSEEWQSYADKLRGLADAMMPLALETVRRRESGFNVLTHGDLWVNNILFRGHASAARLVDFQLAHFTSPVIDLHYFITTSATMEVRMNHIERLLQEYHTALCDTLTVLGYTQTPISLKELHEEFDKEAMIGLYSMIGPYSVMQCEPDCGFNLDDALSRGSIPGRSMYGENYKMAVRWLLPWFESKGVFGNSRANTDMSAEDTDAAPPWMDKQLLELWLRTHYGQVTVTDCEVRPATVKGDNYLSVMHRLLVATKCTPTLSLIVKCRMEEGVTADIMKDSSIFRKEREMYGNTLPRMSALLRRALPGSFETLSPSCIYSCKSFLVLEDLSTSGFSMLDRFQGLDLDHCLLALRTLARFHAASVVLYQQDPDSMTEYEVNFFSEPCLYDNWKRMFSGMTRILVEEIETWPEEWHKYVTKLRRMQENMVDLVHMVTRRNETGFNVLAHGDFWMNNIMFSEKGDSVRIVDFQLVNFTSPCIDLHYFLSTSASLDVRKNHTNTLLQEYHTALCDTLTALGYTQTLMTLKELHEEFNRKSMFGLFAIIAPAACMLSQLDCGFELGDALETGETPGPRMYTDVYRKAVELMLPALDRQGAFDYS